MNLKLDCITIANRTRKSIMKRIRHNNFGKNRPILGVEMVRYGGEGVYATTTQTPSRMQQ